MQEREVTVGELRELYHSGKWKIEIDTPDGFQPIGQWHDKGTLGMVRVTTDSYTTDCAVNHLIQDYEGIWIQASELESGYQIQTRNGIETVREVIEIPNAECYDFEVLHPNHRYYGDGIVSHNSGKSYIASGNVVRNAQAQGIFVVLIDSENALDQSWLEALGVDTSEEKLLKLNMSMIDDVAKTISEFMKEYKSMTDEERPKVLFVVDSLGMLLTPTDVDQFDKGELKGDMGRKPKALTALVRNCVNMFGSYNVGLVATNHTYASQDPYNPDPNISGGAGFIYAASIVIAMKKLKLKEDEDGNKISEVRGIRAGCKIMKTRYAKPFEDAEIKIPYNTGLDPYSGLFDFFEKKQVLRKEGNRYAYVDQTGTEHKYFRKEWNKNEKGILDLVMNEYHIYKKIQNQEVDLDQDSQKIETEEESAVDNSGTNS